jgi:hypothetical protein
MEIFFLKKDQDNLKKTFGKKKSDKKKETKQFGSSKFEVA